MGVDFQRVGEVVLLGPHFEAFISEQIKTERTMMLKILLSNKAIEANGTLSQLNFSLHVTACLYP